MRKILIVLGVVVAIALPAAALATTMEANKFGDLIAKGDKCKDTTEGAWYHFVLNKIDDNVNKAGIGFVAEFKSGGNVTLTTPTFYNNGTAHYWLFSSNLLTGAHTTGNDPGSKASIQLSSVACGKFKDGPPRG